MATFENHQSVYKSPKRKRGDQNSIQYSPSISPSLSCISTDLRSLPFWRSEDEEASGERSPRTKVATRLHDLDLRTTSPTGDSYRRKRIAQSDSERALQVKKGPTDMAETNPYSNRVGDAMFDGQDDPRKNVFDQQPNGTFNLEIAYIPSMIIDRPRMHSRSPPLDGNPEDNPMTWHESEITGYNPTDPDDDGTGINGIGFRPTPAMAWARSQRRKQQLAEYKSREAKEARQRRSERRRKDSGEDMPEGTPGIKKMVKVRFDDS
jgi:hypothetical protein